ncbi:putative FAD FMN-containing isoamyl alcohol oxidase [Rosellinia necatrix]|uniref:Putative FAD FMN-containing isoamyl alcohol oxidase n=1 Tax=Rosellinia necatrix TaxID=77044 RepID=A0A1W2TCE7_ROSNE|nr:putative FAD FMN-containing isoamyl alcohol oxidase [Rosellinia necatrix]
MWFNSKQSSWLLLFWVSIAANRVTSSPSSSNRCRSIPSDENWPSTSQWHALNNTVGGRLIATVPIAAPCHNFFRGAPTYNKERCATLRNTWFLPETHLLSSSSPMAYSSSNDTCNPWLAPNTSCSIGYHVAYAINVNNVSDIQAGLRFAKQHNIRLVIRNTGHDYLGRSTGAHALALWTHNLKTIQTITYNGASYNGVALKLGAGVRAIDAYTFASSHGLQVVGGNCPTVGLAGGYSQGGGHGPMASKHGLGADQVLEVEIITADGKLLVANSVMNSDLFWAVRGGGGGTFGIVVSMTVKAFPDTYASTGFITINDTGTNTDRIYEFLGSFLTGTVPGLVDAGVYALFSLTPLGFAMTPAFAPGMHQAELDLLIQPAIDAMQSLNLEYEYSSAEAASFLAAYQSLPAQWNVSDYNTGGRLVSRDVVLSQTDALVQAIRDIGSRTIITGVCFNVSKSVPSPDAVAVNPYFRGSLFNLFFGLPINYTNDAANRETLDDITTELMPPLAAALPNGGAYLNEADVQQPDFQSVFYGAHYPKLLNIKKRYDPDSLFYVKTGVGSDVWEEQLNGRLCRTQR